MVTVETDRLMLRLPIEADRSRFVELFTDPTFMVFANVLDAEAAAARFDRMLANAALIPYAKQPIVERATGVIVGYTGVDWVELDGVDRLEWGWRLVSEVRGRGYATEAVNALLDVADSVSDGEMLCIVDVDNEPSRRVADKVGFEWWRRFEWPEDPPEVTDLLLRRVGRGGPPLLAPA